MKEENYCRVVTEQDGIKVVLEFPEADNVEKRELCYEEEQIRQEVQRILANVLSHRICYGETYPAKRVS